MVAPVSFPQQQVPFNPAAMAAPPPPPPAAPIGAGFPGAGPAMGAPPPPAVPDMSSILGGGGAGAPPPDLSSILGGGGPMGAPSQPVAGPEAGGMPDLNALLSQLGGGGAGGPEAAGGAGSAGGGGLDLSSLMGPGGGMGEMPGMSAGGDNGLIGNLLSGGATKYLVYGAVGLAALFGFKALRGGGGFKKLLEPLTNLKNNVLKAVGLKKAAPSAEQLTAQIDDLAKQQRSLSGKVKRGTAEQSELDAVKTQLSDLRAQRKTLSGDAGSAAGANVDEVA